MATACNTNSLSILLRRRTSRRRGLSECRGCKSRTPSGCSGSCGFRPRRMPPPSPRPTTHSSVAPGRRRSAGRSSRPSVRRHGSGSLSGACATRLERPRSPQPRRRVRCLRLAARSGALRSAGLMHRRTCQSNTRASVPSQRPSRCHRRPRRGRCHVPRWRQQRLRQRPP
jgi:hypothetical protein